MSYNGWPNYETWAVNLWLTNEETSDSYWRIVARQTWNGCTPSEHLTRSEHARFDLADQIKSEMEGAAPDLCGTLWGDLLTAALSEVCWDTIADGFLEDCEGYEMAPAALLND